jgi:hypothetical protein
VRFGGFVLALPADLADGRVLLSGPHAGSSSSIADEGSRRENRSGWQATFLHTKRVWKAKRDRTVPSARAVAAQICLMLAGCLSLRKETICRSLFRVTGVMGLSLVSARLKI